MFFASKLLFFYMRFPYLCLTHKKQTYNYYRMGEDYVRLHVIVTSRVA